MKLRFLLSLFSGLLLLSGITAQTTAERAAERATNRAENRAQSNVDRRVDGAVDDAFNAIGGLFGKKKKKKKKRDAEEEQNADNEASTAMLQNMGLMGGDWEPYTNPATFSLTMDITQTKRNGRTESSSADMTVTETNFAIKTIDPESDMLMRMILDTQTGKTTIVTVEDGETTAMRMSMPGLGKAIHEAAVEEFDIDVNRTGERRTIDGYDCEKIIITDNQTGDVTTSWVTKDVPFKIEDIAATFGGMTRGKNPALEAMDGEYPGFPIETTFTDGRETLVLHYRNIKTGNDIDRSILDVSGLQIQDLGF